MAKLDFAGISILIAGSSCPPIYYALYCPKNDFLRSVYLSITILSNLAAFISMFIPWVSHPKNKKWRAIIFVTVGASSIYALAHFWLFRDETMPIFDPTFWLLGGGVYIFGAFVYAIKFPESSYPGRFDY